MNVPPEEIRKTQQRLQGLSDVDLEIHKRSAEHMVAFWQRRLADTTNHLADYQRQLQQYLAQDIDNKDPLTKEMIEMVVRQDQEDIQETHIDLAFDQMNLQLCLQEESSRQKSSQ